MALAGAEFPQRRGLPEGGPGLEDQRGPVSACTGALSTRGVVRTAVKAAQHEIVNVLKTL